MPRVRLVSATCVVLLAIAAGCASGKTANMGGTPTTQPTATFAPTTSLAPTTTATTTTSPTTTTTTSTSTTTTVAPTTTTTPPRPFVETACPQEPTQPARVRCGYVEVLERHAQPDGPTLKIAVAIVAPAGAVVQPDPIVFLAGGPGSGSVERIDQFLLNSWTDDREMVLVDYRGVGASQPSLACPEVDAFDVPSLDIAPGDAKFAAERAAAVLACHDRLVAAGVDLAAYNYEEIAADIADLRTSLGYDEWNVYGISQGGRLALELLRRHPEGIRSVVLDAPGSPQGNLVGELWPNAQRAIETLFKGCAADATCAAAFPDLAQTYESLLAEVRANPVEVQAQLDGNAVPVKFTDALLVNALRVALYDETLIPLIPLFIASLEQGAAFSDVAQLVVDRSSPNPNFSTGLSLSVRCAELVPRLPPDIFDLQAAQFPTLAPAILDQTEFAECAVWDVPAADASFAQQVDSEIPALVVVGEYDPVHPRTNSEQAAAGLTNSTLIEFPGLGHGVVGRHACATSLVDLFLADPSTTLSTGCVDSMSGPAWFV